MQLVIFCEELSAKVFLDEFLPPLLPQGVTLRTIPHQGKTDLQRSLPKKLRAWVDPQAKFVVLHDKDHNDCQELKAQLRKICTTARPDIKPLIRIACHELESWYLGDPQALQSAFPKFKPESVQGKAKFRNVDALANAAEELTKIIPKYQKVSASRILGGLMSPDNNASHSFQVFWKGIKTLLN
jgi:hypothetical protein